MFARLRHRLKRLEQRRRGKELPPLIIREHISAAEAQKIESDWIREHGWPGPLIITLKSPDLSTLRAKNVERAET
jgi:hypothetical protein